MNIQDNIPQDDHLQKLFRENAPKMPFPDFADQLMEKISAEDEAKEKVTSNLRLSWIFYILGVLSGIAFTLFAGNSTIEIYNISLQKLLLPMLAVASFVFIIIFEKLIKAGKSNNF